MVFECVYVSGQGGIVLVCIVSIMISVISGVMLIGWSKFYVQVSGMGVKFCINNVGMISGLMLIGSVVDMIGNVFIGNVIISFDIYVCVCVCDNSVGVGGLESNCKQYGMLYKLEGLIQQYLD